MKNILVIDDSQFNLMVVEKALEKEYQVTCKLSGKEGIIFAQKNPVDLILLDIEMPELSGMDTIRLLKRDKKLAEIPVIFLTGLNDNEVEKACLDLGARDFITKPFNEPVMLQRIKIILELEDLRKNLERQVKIKTEELEKLTGKIISTFASSVDPLTSLWSRMYVREQVNWEISRYTLLGALVVVNIDNFRVLNEALGHEKGDLCLQCVADSIKNIVGEKDIVGRSGADEFLIYLPQVNTKEETENKIKEVFKEVKERLEQEKFDGVTLSAGGIMTIEGGKNFESLYHFAERALHRAKENGKNAIEFYS